VLLEVYMVMSTKRRGGPNLAFDCPPGTVYDEEAFGYLLDIERARAGRSKRPVRILFATVEPVPGTPVAIPRASAARLFDCLKASLRETDVMGWYRQDRVAGAVLGARAGAPGFETPGVIEERVGDGLRQRLPPQIARSLRVRVVQRDPRQSARGQGVGSHDRAASGRLHPR
jgi:hypothetical protein